MRCKGAVEWKTRKEKEVKFRLWSGVGPNRSMWSAGWPPSSADRQDWKLTLRRVIFRLTSDPEKYKHISNKSNLPI